jgi:hypothetical protein
MRPARSKNQPQGELKLARILCARSLPEVPPADTAGDGRNGKLHRVRNSPHKGGVQQGMGRPLLVLAATLILILPRAAAQRGNESQREAKQVSLWAAISIPQPIFSEGGTAKLQISFGVYNDGPSTVNPKIGASHLYINGVEPKDWLIIIGNGLRTPEFEALSPGHFLSFSYMLGRYFEKPGVYRLRWEGENFGSPELTFRVVPAKR